MKTRSKTVSGFSLVEVALALGIASFCLLTLMTLIPVGVQHYQDADTQSAMVNLANMVARDLQATPSMTSAAASPRFGFSIPAAGGTAVSSPETVYVDITDLATGTVVNAAPTTSSVYRISVFFSSPTPSTVRSATLARILITFPANADATATTTPSKFVDMFETTIALNRN